MQINIKKFQKAANELNNNERTKGLKLELKKVTIEPVESDVELYLNLIKKMKEKELNNQDYIDVLDYTYGNDEDYDFYKSDNELYEIFYINPIREMASSIIKSTILEKVNPTTSDVKKILVPQIFYNYCKNAFLENPELVLSILLQIIDKASNKLYKISFEEVISISEEIVARCGVKVDSEDYIDSFNTIYSLFDLFNLEITIDPEEKLIKFGSKLLDCFETNLLDHESDFNSSDIEVDRNKADKVANDYINYYSE